MTPERAWVPVPPVIHCETVEIRTGTYCPDEITTFVTIAGTTGMFVCERHARAHDDVDRMIQRRIEDRMRFRPEPPTWMGGEQ